LCYLIFSVRPFVLFINIFYNYEGCMLRIKFILSLLLSISLTTHADRVVFHGQPENTNNPPPSSKSTEMQAIVTAIAAAAAGAGALYLWRRGNDVLRAAEAAQIAAAEAAQIAAEIQRTEAARIAAEAATLARALNSGNSRPDSGLSLSPILFAPPVASTPEFRSTWQRPDWTGMQNRGNELLERLRRPARVPSSEDDVDTDSAAAAPADTTVLLPPPVAYLDQPPPELLVPDPFDYYVLPPPPPDDNDDDDNDAPN
jgi:hypothetical protein